jgi:hypothetical protein
MVQMLKFAPEGSFEEGRLKHFNNRNLVLVLTTPEKSALGFDAESPYSATFASQVVRQSKKTLDSKNVNNVAVRFEKGQRYACKVEGRQAAECAQVDVKPEDKDYADTVDYESYIVSEMQPKDGYVFTAFIRTATPASPLNLSER